MRPPMLAGASLPALAGGSGRRGPLAAASGLAVLLCAVALGAWGGRYERVSLRELALADAAVPVDGERLAALRRRLAAQAPRGPYAVVDTYRNRLLIYRDGQLEREAVCSTGSGLVLRHRESGREWIFDTPLGERRVEKKTRDPVWVKPDWAFVEEGFEPPEGVEGRIDDVSLGDYGIYLGDGYLIHGTLFQSLLGQKITHGCIRLGDDDLALLYRTLRVGDRVYLF